MILFIDTEFSSLMVDQELISIAFVDETGERELYLENSTFEEAKASYFVLEAVIPLLGPPKAMLPGTTYIRTPFKDFARIITEWVAPYPMRTEIGCDNGFDFVHLVDALDGDFPPNVLSRPMDLHKWISAPGFEKSRMAYHRAHNLPMHHALYDARSLWAGYCKAVSELADQNED